MGGKVHKKRKTMALAAALLVAGSQLLAGCATVPRVIYTGDEAAPKKSGIAVVYPEVEEAVIRADKRVFNVHTDRGISGLSYYVTLHVELSLEPTQITEAMEVLTNILKALKTKYPGDVDTVHLSITSAYNLPYDEAHAFDTLEPVMYVGEIPAEGRESLTLPGDSDEFIAPDGSVYSYDGSHYVFHEGILYKKDHYLIVWNRESIDSVLASWQKIFAAAKAAESGKGSE